MKCPYCHEEIERHSTTCLICGEHIPSIYSTIDKIKEYLIGSKARATYKIITLVILTLISITLLTVISINVINSNKLTENGYKSIQVNYQKKNSILAIFSDIANQERDLLKYFKYSKDKENNSILFKIFMDSVAISRNNFFDIYNDSKTLEEYGIKIEEPLDIATKPVKIVKPNINIFKFPQGAPHDGYIGLMDDYDYMIKTYSPYLTEDWVEYLELIKQENEEFNKTFELGIGFNNKKWLNKWKNFNTKYPNFLQKQKVEEKILEYEDALQFVKY